jgi:glc operon protein GlcG
MKEFAGRPWRVGGAVFSVVIAAAVFTGCFGNSWASQLPKAVEETRFSDVHDSAKLFGDRAIAVARAGLRSIESKTGVASMIATVVSLDGRSLENEAQATAKKSGIEGLFILISKADKKIQVLVSRRYAGAILRRQREVIRASFAQGFSHGDFDEGLKHGVVAIGEALVSAQRSGELPGKTAAGPLVGPSAPFGKPAGPLVLRNQVRLTLSGAQVLIAAAKEKAQSLKLNVNVAVVDDGGHLIAFERMDGARPASAYTAITKATSAATFRQASGPLGSGGAGPDLLLNLSLQNAAMASGGKITTLYGGVPVVVDEQVIGAVGVGGGTGEQDAQIGKAGIAALLEQLGSAQQKEMP